MPFSAPPHADEWYHPFCARLFRLYSVCLAQGLKVTTKTLDTYIWAIPT